MPIIILALISAMIVEVIVAFNILKNSDKIETETFWNLFLKKAKLRLIAFLPAIIVGILFFNLVLKLFEALIYNINLSRLGQDIFIYTILFLTIGSFIYGAVVFLRGFYYEVNSQGRVTSKYPIISGASWGFLCSSQLIFISKLVFHAG